MATAAAAPELRALDDQYMATGVPLLLFAGDGEERAAFPAEFGGMYSRQFLVELVRELSEAENSPGIIRVMWEELYFCAATALSGGKYLVTAPVSFAARPHAAILNLAAERVNRERWADFLRLISELPFVGSSQLVKTVSVCRVICGLEPADDITEQRLAGQRSEYAETPSSPEQRHASFFETRIIEAIQAGDPDELKRAYERPPNGYIGRMSLDSLRQTKYYFVCFMYFASRAATAGGAPKEECMRMSDMFCQQMDAMNSTGEVMALLWESLVTFCRRVSEYKSTAEYSSVTKMCCEYINAHLYEPIRSEDLARYCRIGQRSILRHFRRDTGMTPSQYISRKRLKEAAVLLRETELSLGEISYLLQYSSQSHFGKVFSDAYGTTPQRYRNLSPHQ